MFLNPAKIGLACFGASYLLSFLLELAYFFRPRPIFRTAALVFAGAGLFAHTAFLLVQRIPIVSSQGSLLLLALVLAIFCVYGALHHRHFAWGYFVLPVVLFLVALAAVYPQGEKDPEGILASFGAERFWGMTHGILVLAAAVGVSVGFVASVMYLVQVRRLQAKLAPYRGMKMMSLERLEAMNRRAILWAFPLLTVGLILGAILQLGRGDVQNAKIWGTVGLWIVFAILMFLRYAIHVRGRQVALWTILAFVVMLVALLASHGETT